MNKIRDLIRTKPIIWMVIIVGIILFFQFQIHIDISSNDLINGVIKETIFAIVSMFFVFLIAGKDEVLFSTKGLAYTLRKSWWLLTIPFVLGVGLTVITVLFGSRTFDLGPSIIIAFLDAFATGIYEESLLRGLVFNALLSKEGGSYKGIFTAIIVSSLFFGFLHVAPDFFSSFPNISLDLASQMVGKTVQSGMLGFLMAAIYLRNHNLWNIALIHALNDFFLMVPVYMLNTGTGNYVQSSGSLSGGLVYYAQIILSIPYIITAIRIVKHTSLPQYGFYKETWKPIAIDSKF